MDDDGDILALVEAVLAEEGYEVSVARNGREALGGLSRSLPDLILLDLAMPVMNGWEFVRALRERGEVARVPIVVMTASPQPSGQVLPASVTAYLAKPFDLDDLLSCVAKSLGQHEPAVLR